MTERCPQATVCLDLFHIVKAANDTLHTVRREARRDRSPASRRARSRGRGSRGRSTRVEGEPVGLPLPPLDFTTGLYERSLLTRLDRQVSLVPRSDLARV